MIKCCKKLSIETYAWSNGWWFNAQQMMKYVSVVTNRWYKITQSYFTFNKAQMHSDDKAHKSKLT